MYRVAIFEITKMAISMRKMALPAHSISDDPTTQKNTGCLSCIQIGSNWCPKKMFNNLLTHILPNAKHQKKNSWQKKHRSKKTSNCVRCQGVFFFQKFFPAFLVFVVARSFRLATCFIRSSTITHPMVSDSDWRVGAPMHWTFLDGPRLPKCRDSEIQIWRCFKVPNKKMGGFSIEIPN